MAAPNSVESRQEIPHRWVGRSLMWIGACSGLTVTIVALYFLGAIVSGVPSASHPSASAKATRSPSVSAFDPVATAGFRIETIPPTQAGVSGDAALTRAYAAAMSRVGAQHQAMESDAAFGDVYKASRLICRCWVVVMVDVRQPLCPATRVDAEFVFLIDEKTGGIVAAVAEPAPAGTTFGRCSAT